MDHGLPLKLEGVRGICTRVPFKDKFSDFMIANIKIEDPTWPDIDGRTFSFKGNLFLKPKQPVYIQTASFDEKSDMKYGGTYLDAVLSYDIDFESASKSEVQKYLSFITSETLAKGIVDTLDNPIEVINTADIKKLTSVSGIGEHTAQRIIEQHSNNKDYSLALSVIPSKYGITDNATREIVDYYGGNNELAIEQLEEDTYHVVNIPKFGFKTADEMFLKANKDDANKHTDPRRVRAYINYMFDSYYMDGAAWLSDDELIHNLGVNIPGFNVKYVTEYLKDKDRFIIIPTKNESGKSSRIASVKYATVEMKIANRLIEMVNTEDTREYENVEEIIDKVQTQQGFEFDDSQREAIYSMLSSNVLLLQGFSGTGKSSVLGGLSKVLTYNQLMIGQSALSGRAASNLEEITGITGQTIHRLLRYGQQNPYNKDNKLPHDVIIVDEISMVSNDIFLQLIEAMKDGAKLIMVGDLGQLPSIGVGPAKGIVNSNIVPSVVLKNIHRQAKESAVITHSIAFRHGEKPEGFDFKNRTYGAKEDLTYLFVHKDAEPQIEGLAIEMFKQKIEQYQVNDIAIITSTRKFVYNLNIMAQRIANPPSPSKKEFVVNESKNNEYTLRVGDKVMNVRNNYNTVNIHDELQPIFNGNTGVILDIVESDKSIVAIIEFDGVDTVKVPLSKFGSPIELGYSMTTHKCVTGDTFINTNKGTLQIKDMDNGAEIGKFKEIKEDVSVFNGSYYEKPSHFYNNGVDTVRCISTYKGYEIKATKEHGVDVYRDGDINRVDAEELKVGDSLVIQLGADNINEYQDIPNRWYDYKLYHNSIITPKKPKVVDENFAKFLGYMVGDGTVTKEKGNSIKLSKKDKEVTQDFYELIVELFGYTKDEPIKFRKSGDFMCEINSADINRFCLNIDGIQANDKFVPDIIMKSPQSVQVAFLSGIFEDGWAREKEGAFDHIGISLMSEKCIKQIQIMLLNMGVITTMRKRIQKDKKYGVERCTYSLNIFKYDCRIMLEKGFSFKSKYKQGTLLKCLIDSKYSRKTNYTIIDHQEYGFLFIDEITNITEHEEQTYCLTMPETHKFIQNGIHAYNSQGDTIKSVIVALPYQYMLNTKELLYTAITRASDECFIITSPRTLKATYQKSSDQVQRSNLQLFLQYNDIMNEKYFK